MTLERFEGVGPIARGYESQSVEFLGAGARSERAFLARSGVHALMQRFASASDRLAATRGFRSVSGIERFDLLATEYPEQLQQFLRDVEANGWIVKESRLLSPETPAYFFPRKGRFYYDPERMTYLDMLHEASHLETFAARGNWKLGKYNILASQDEVVAYSRELQFLREAGGANPKYLEYLERQIEFYRRLPEALREMQGDEP